MAQCAIAGPFHIPYLGDEPRFDPMNRPGHDRRGKDFDRTQHLRNSIEPSAQVSESLLVKARADLAREVQDSAPIVVAEDQRAEARPRAGRIRVADHHELLTVDALDLEPAAAATRLVGRRASL